MSPATKILINSRRPTGATTEIVASDYLPRPSMWGQRLPRPPADWVNRVHWFTASYETILTPMPTNVESNFAPTVASFTALNQQLISTFDQYCFEEMSITFLAAPSQASANVQMVPLYTAIDYDNNTNTGLPFMLGLSSCALCCLSPTTTITRWCQPAIASELLNQSAAAVGAGVMRSWIDSTYLNIPHYGFKTILEQSLSNLRISCIVTVLVGCRNST